MIRNIKNLRIIKVLLNNPKGNLTKYKIAKVSETSIPWTIQFLKKLEVINLIQKTKVLDYNKLIDYYLTVDKGQKYYNFQIPNVINFLRNINLEYSLTTFGAENQISHHLSPFRYDVYIHESDLLKWKELILRKGLIGQGNLRLIITNEKEIFNNSRIINELNVVSIPQLLIDLKKEGGVAIEAYNLIVKEYV